MSASMPRSAHPSKVGAGWLALFPLALALGIGSAEARPPSAPMVIRSATGLTEPQSRLADERLVELRKNIDGILGSALLRKARVGLLVVDAASGEPVLNRNAELPFNPASNTKILTTAAALGTLGADFRYQTVLLAQKRGGATAPQPDEDGVLHGDVFLQGSADPSLTPTALAELARELARAGVKRIEGDVRVDGEVRDLAQLLSQPQAQSYGRGSLILNRDRYSVKVSPGSVGHSGAVWVEPRLPYFRIRNLTRTVKGKKSRILVDHSNRGDYLEVTVRGRIGDHSRGVVKRQRLFDPSAWAAATLGQALADFGITVGGSVRVGGPPAGPLGIVAEHRSAPLSEICRVINKDSNNFVADTLFKTLGAARYGLPGTLEKGSRAVAEWLAPLGLEPSRFHLVNGSGLTHENRVRPLDLGKLLYRLYHTLELGPEFMQSLAVGGVDGTIHHRFRGALTGLVRGKTGTLDGVSVLSGYLGGQPGVLVFCIFMEGFRPRRLPAMRQTQGRIVEELMRFLRKDAPGLHPTIPAGTPGIPPLRPEPAGPDPTLTPTPAPADEDPDTDDEPA